MQYEKILVGYDGSDHAKKAVSAAIELAEVTAAKEVHILNVTEYYVTLHAADNNADFAADPAVISDADRQALEQEMKDFVQGSSAPISTEIIFGAPNDTLPRIADERESDLIVLGSRGLSQVAGSLGSVSYGVLSRSKIPVLIIK